MRPALLMAAVLGGVLATPPEPSAKVFYAREEMFELAFPDAERVVATDFFLTADQRALVEERARTRLDSDLVTVYVGHREGEVIGYAFVDTHVVRTLPETFLIVLDAAGRVADTHVLAFYEPLEYLPSERWLAQLDRKRLTDDLRVGGEIVAITGSTLSSRAVVGGVRRALALYEVLLAKCASSSQENGRETSCSK